MINPNSSSSSGDAGVGSSSNSGIQFRMTVKLDIEGRVPSNSDAQSVCAAASSSTQDLLLKLQPLLPHISITGTMKSNNEDDNNDNNNNPELLAEQETREADVTNSTTSGGATGGAAGGAVDETGLELSLGLSSFKEMVPGKGQENPGAQGAQIHQDSGGGGGLQRQTSNAALEWRVSEEQRLKREAQFQKRQEARKKRRIRIDEQKRLKSPGAGATKRSDEGGGGGENQRRIRRGLCRRGSVKSEPAAPEESCSSARIDAGDWAQKFAEIQRLARGGGGSEIQQGGGEDENNKPKPRLARQMSLNFGLSSPPPGAPLASPPPLPPGESVSSSLTCAPFAVPAPVSPNKAHPQAQDCPQVKPHQQQSPAAKASQGSSSPLHDCSNRSDSRGALLRSASLGAGFFDLHQEKQRQHSIQMPSPVRCSSSSTNSSLLRTLSEGAAMRSILMGISGGDDERHFCWRKTPQRGDPSKEQQQQKPASAFRSPKKEPADGSSLTSNTGSGPQTASASSSPVQLPWVTATGTRTVSGVLLAYKKGEVRIVCSCHGQHMSAREFVQHAGGGDVPNPEKCIVVSPSRRLNFNSPS